MADIEILSGLKFSIEHKRAGHVGIIRRWYVQCYFECGSAASGALCHSSLDTFADIQLALKKLGWKERLSDCVWECPECARTNRFGRKMPPEVKRRNEKRAGRRGWGEMSFGANRDKPAKRVIIPGFLIDP